MRTNYAVLYSEDNGFSKVVEEVRFIHSGTPTADEPALVDFLLSRFSTDTTTDLQDAVCGRRLEMDIT